MEDVRLGRETTARQDSIALSTTPQQVLGYNKNRVAVVLGSDSATHIHWQSGANRGAGTGFIVMPAGGPVTFDIQKHGVLVHGPWFADAGAGTPTVAFAETILEKQ